MGNCIHCGEAAGFLKKAHKECKENHRQGRSEIAALVRNAAAHPNDLTSLAASIYRIATSAHIDRNTLKALVVSGWEQAVESAFEDGILTREEEAALGEVRQHFSLTQQDLDKNGALTRMIKGAVLRDILDGTLPERIRID